MGEIMSGLVHLFSRFLEPHEREAVCGDLEESGVRGAQALRDIFGLVVRRQVELWKDWRPWVTLSALTIPAAVLLTLVSTALARSCDLYFWIARNYGAMDLSLLKENHLSLAQGAEFITSRSFWLAVNAWASGFCLAFLSPRTARVSGAILFFVLAWEEFQVVAGYQPGSTSPWRLFPPLLQIFVVLPSVIWGVGHGRRLGLAFHKENKI
jgi:hypothetical protein